MSFPCSRARALALLLLLLCVSSVACVTNTTSSRRVRVAPAAAAHAPALAADPIPRLLVLAAMPSELTPLLERAAIERTVVVDGRTHHLGVLGGVDVVLVAGGVTDLERCNAAGRCVEGTPEVILAGNGVSGPTFVDHADYRAYVWQTFQADALDMETAAVAHVAFTHNIPFLAVRGISDLAGGERGENEVGNFFGVAAVNAAVVTEAFVRGWASR